MRPSLLLLVAGAALAACAGRERVASPAPLDVSFAWAAIDRCTPRSPEIRVDGLPAAATVLDVRMTDLNVPTFPHGGGEVPRPADGVIPAGALRGYAGPCPPGAPHPYQITVEAVDAANRIIATGRAVRPFPP